MTVLAPSAVGITARSIVSDALRLINRLSPGETLDADAAADCLASLNSIADEINGSGTFLWREVLTASSPITGDSGALGVDWPSIAVGTLILGATVNDGTDEPMSPLTMAQYHALSSKDTTGTPCCYAHDGAATVYLYPVPTSRVVTLRTRAAMSEFADLDTEYSMPAGYRANLAALLAERVAPVLSPEMLGHATRAAGRARAALRARNANPAIIGADRCRGSIINGDR